jgi:Mu transposase-like protein
MGRDKVELFARIRDDHRQLGLGVRALARRYGVHRRTVREALGSPVPAPRKTPVRRSELRDLVGPRIDAMLREDLDAPRKQRHTSRRIWQRLADEQGVAVSYSYVCQYAGQRRAQIEAEHRAAAGSVAGFVPQAKEPGAEAEVDFGPVTVVVDGDQLACQMFAYRLSYSGKGVHRVYASCAQEAFFEGHVTAFEVTGGVPWRHIRYDNLSPAVAKVMTGRSRAETSRWLSFRSWYGFEAFYCIPGQEGAHEKGGVEGEIGRFRRRFLVPVPRVGSLAELNAQLAEADVADGRRHIEFRTASVAEDFTAEQPLLGPLPAEGFDTGTVLWPRADKFARISVGKCRYSVPARMIGTRVRTRVTASELEVFDGSRKVAVHPRLAAAGAEHLVLDHYLEILLRKPGALPGSVPLAQARAAGTFTAAHQQLWDAARARLGDGPGTKTLIEVLLLHRRLPPASVTAGIRAALAAGTCSADVVAVEARKHADAAGPAKAAVTGALAGPRAAGAAVITLPRRRGPLPPDGRAAPSVAAYDQLLRRPQAGTEGGA